MAEEGVKCQHCGKLPQSVKYCHDNMVHYNFKCDCKETPLRRSYMIAESEWENEFSKTDPSKMPKIKTEKGVYYI